MRIIDGRGEHVEDDLRRRARPSAASIRRSLRGRPLARSSGRRTSAARSAGSHVTKMIFEPARRARVSAPRTNCVMPLADTPITTSFLVGRKPVDRPRAFLVVVLDSLARLDHRVLAAGHDRLHQVVGIVPKVGGISADSSTPSRPLVPAPTKMIRPPRLSACVMMSIADGDAILLALHGREHLAILVEHALDDVGGGRACRSRAWRD